MLMVLLIKTFSTNVNEDFYLHRKQIKWFESHNRNKKKKVIEMGSSPPVPLPLPLVFWKVLNYHCIRFDSYIKIALRTCGVIFLTNPVLLEMILRKYNYIGL